jgi:siroheme synthase-like protein
VNSTSDFFRGYIPLIVNLDNRRVVVVGGGKVAYSKTIMLLNYNARVIIVSPEISALFDDLVSCRIIRWWKKKFTPACLKGAALAVAATARRQVNNAVVRAARVSGVKCVNTGAGGLPELSSGSLDKDCSFCSVVRRGGLLLGISTCGGAPALSKYVRKKLEKTFPHEWTRVYSRFTRLRRELMRKVEDPGSRILFWDSLIASDAVEHVLNGDDDGFLREVEKCFSLLQV